MKLDESKCVSCYTCEKGVSATVTAAMWKKAEAEGKLPPEWFTEGNGKCAECQSCFTAQSGSKEKVSTYFLFLTNECNLRCDYCYATKKPMIMSNRDLEQMKVFLTKMEDIRLGTPRRINVQFFGGEPTMMWGDLERFITEFSLLAEKLYGPWKDHPSAVQWGMTTNGTLLTRERLTFLKKYGCKPLLSLDGRRETHDAHRKTTAGGGSFDNIPLADILEFFPDIEIRPTICPDTVGTWDEDLQWFYSKGVYSVATEVAYEADWSEYFYQARKMFERLADIYVERRKKNLPVWMKFIEDGKAMLGAAQQTGTVCGTANGLCAIDSYGKLYACQRYASFSNPALAIGDIWHGFEEHALAVTQGLKREDMRPEEGIECEGCVARWRCRGGCNAMNFQVNGDRKIITKSHCEFHKMWAEITLKALAQTGELWNKGTSQCQDCK